MFEDLNLQTFTEEEIVSAFRNETSLEEFVAKCELPFTASANAALLKVLVQKLNQPGINLHAFKKLTDCFFRNFHNLIFQKQEESLYSWFNELEEKDDSNFSKEVRSFLSNLVLLCNQYGRLLRDNFEIYADDFEFLFNCLINRHKGDDLSILFESFSMIRDLARSQKLMNQFSIDNLLKNFTFLLPRMQAKQINSFFETLNSFFCRDQIDKPCSFVDIEPFFQKYSQFEGLTFNERKAPLVKLNLFLSNKLIPTANNNLIALLLDNVIDSLNSSPDNTENSAQILGLNSTLKSLFEMKEITGSIDVSLFEKLMQKCLNTKRVGASVQLIIYWMELLRKKDQLIGPFSEQAKCVFKQAISSVNTESSFWRSRLSLRLKKLDPDLENVEELDECVQDAVDLIKEENDGKSISTGEKGSPSFFDREEFEPPTKKQCLEGGLGSPYNS